MMKQRLLLLTVLLTGCAKPIPQTPSKFEPPVIVKRVHDERPLSVSATFGYRENPNVLAAYQKFIKTGKKPRVSSSGFTTLPFDAYKKQIITCAPLHLCVVQLEQGENINNIELGDSAHWMVHTALIGTLKQGSYQISIKPKLTDVATDMIVTTDKRSYHFGLLSKHGNASTVVNFYYPEESLIRSKHLQRLSGFELSYETGKRINLKQLNFNYTISRNRIAWRPHRVFDDGHKTYIEMPSISEQLDLPVLYIKHQKNLELVNYRYQKPYYIVDGLFQSAKLVSGKGRVQQSVMIHNNRLLGGV